MGWVRVIPFLLGVGLLVFGLVSVILYYGQPKPQTVGGTSVMSAWECTGGYGVGSCPIIANNWTGTLVYPSPGLVGGLAEIWRLQGTSADTCGLPATYLLNLPMTTSNGTTSEVGGTPEPPYVPLGHGVEGVITYGSLVYAYTSDRYTIADGCSGKTLANFAGPPVQGTITYTLDGTRTLVLGTGGTYDFSAVNGYLAVLIPGGFVTIFGFYWAFGGVVAEEPDEGSGAGRPGGGGVAPAEILS